MRRLYRLAATVFAAALIVPNLGVILDGMAYREPLAQARAILPQDWRAVQDLPPEAQIAALTLAQSADQQAAMERLSARFRSTAQGAVLAIPRGFETEELRLDDGCFRFARRRVRLLVWHYETAIGCL